MAPVGNWTSEAELDAMKRRGWVERGREELPHERRILVRLWHPHQTVGEGSDRYCRSTAHISPKGVIGVPR